MQVKLIAHRGYAAHYPENTMIGIEAAIEAGAHFVEVDVQLTADGTLVLFHDRALDRMCGAGGAIADYTAQELARFSASEPDRFGKRFARIPIATLRELAELIQQSPDIQFFIELKRISIKRYGADLMLEQVIRTLESLRQQCTLISFDAEILEMARLRGWRTGLVVEHWHTERGQVLNVAHDKKRKGACNIQDLTPFPFLFCDIEGLPSSGDLHLPNTSLAVYEVADPEQARSLTARGVDFIETFAIEEMRAALSKL